MIQTNPKVIINPLTLAQTFLRLNYIVSMSNDDWLHIHFFYFCNLQLAITDTRFYDLTGSIQWVIHKYCFKYVRPWTQNMERNYFCLDFSYSIIYILGLAFNNLHGNYFHWWILFLFYELLLIIHILNRFLFHFYYIYKFINSLFRRFRLIFKFHPVDFLTIGETFYLPCLFPFETVYLPIEFWWRDQWGAYSLPNNCHL